VIENGMRRFPMWLIFFMGGTACGPNGAGSGSAPPGPTVMTFTMQTREMTFDDCVAGSEGCTYIRFDYPVVVEAPPGAAIEAFTSVIDSFLQAPLHQDEPASSVNALMARFLADYAAYKASQPQPEIAWFLERKAFVLRSTPNLLSLSLSERSFLGGAHGLATVHYVNLDPASGGKIALTDVLEDAALPEVTRLAEARLREVRAVPEGMTLKEAGFTFENDLFALPDNFVLREDGLAFYYNPYEVAPYAMGPTEILLSSAEIEDLLAPEFVRKPEMTEEERPR
jgi:hypothetical protein